MIKKLILISSMVFATSIWADQDDICYVQSNYGLGEIDQAKTPKLIKKECDKNDIFRVEHLSETGLSIAIYQWCRFDREIHTIKQETGLYVGKYKLLCVLHDTEPRETKVILY